LISGLPKSQDPNLLVGYHTSDDAGIYRLNDETALVSTVDIITPPVDDPFLFGQIAAANSISDVYAMGGRPLTCLNIAAFPSQKLDKCLLEQIIHGALTKIEEAGAVLAGGHTIDDDEPKFGLAVNGLVHPKKFWANNGAQEGDILILTKPLGSGVVFNANLKKLASKEELDACLNSLTTLNRSAAEILSFFDVHAVTDVTGFGLAGHALEMAKNSKVRLEIDLDLLPVMNGALRMYKQGVNTGMNRPNRKLSEKFIRFAPGIDRIHQEIVFDPQTSGGLLCSLPEDQAVEALGRLTSEGVAAARIIGGVSALRDEINIFFKKGT
jgi:selenide,water dikinase